MTDDKIKRRIFIRENVQKNYNSIDEIEFEFIEHYQTVERTYSLWLTQEHYTKTILQMFASRSIRKPAFEEYIDFLRVLISGHCSNEKDFLKIFQMIDRNRNGLIELNEFNELISIIGRSASEEKISNLFEHVNSTDDQCLNYEQFKTFIRLGFGRELLLSVSM